MLFCNGAGGAAGRGTILGGRVARVNSIVNLLKPDFTTCVLYPGDEVPSWASVGAHLIADDVVEVEPVEVESPVEVEPVKPKRGRPVKKKHVEVESPVEGKDPFDMSRDELVELAKQRGVVFDNALTDSELAALLD